MFQIGIPSDFNINSKKVIEFFRKEWSKPIPLKDVKFYAWQFVNVPNQNNIDNCCIAVDRNLNIIGVMGINNRPFILKNKSFIAGELTTWIVTKEYRLRGVGPKIIDYLTSKYEILFGMGITSDALSLYLRKGFKYLKAIPRYVKVLNWERIEQTAQYSQLAKKVNNLYEKKVAAKHLLKSPTKEVVNTIFQKFYKNNNLFSRSYEYILWRYLKHPYFKYDIKIICSHEKGGYGVLLVTRVEIASNGIRILHIIDLFGDERDIETAIDFCIDFSLNNKIDVIDFFCTSTSVNKYFIRKGWFSILDHSFLNFPHLFQPIELREPATTSLIFWTKYNDSLLYDVGKLYITKQDADFDRPILRK